MRTTIACALAASLMLSACATTGTRGHGALEPQFVFFAHKTPQQKLTCDGSRKCELPVSVDCVLFVCRIGIDYDPIVVTDKPGAEVAWVLPDGDWRFDETNGIALDPDGRSEFTCHREQNGLRFACIDKHSKCGVYKYTINVKGPVAVPPLDPWIANN
jgi:hypothetical protein